MLVKIKLLPLLRSNIKIVVGMTVVLALGIVSLICLSTSYLSLEYTCDKFYEEFHMADISLYTFLSNEQLTEQLEAESGVDRAEERLVLSMLAERHEQKGINVRMIGYVSEHTVNLADFIEQLDHKDADKIYVYPERDLYLNNGFSLGEAITVSFNNKKTEVFIGGYFGSPECAVLREAPFHFDAHDYGIMYVDYEQLLELSDLPNGSYNQLLIMTDSKNADQDNSKLLKQIEAKEYLQNVIASFTHENAAYTKMIDRSLYPLKKLSYVIPSLFFCLTIVVLYLLLNQTIMEQRREIGVFRAFGFPGSQIWALYASYTVLIAVIAIIVGTVAGLIAAKFITALYADLFMIINVYTKVDYTGIIVAALASVFACQLSCTLAVRSIIKQQPAWLMQDRKRTTGITSTLRIIDKYLLANNEMLRVCLHSLMRNMRRTLLSALIVTLASVIIIVAASSFISVENVTSFSFGKQFIYDLQVKATDWVDAESIENAMQGCAGISDYEVSMFGTATVEYAGNEQVIGINGISDNSELIALFDDSMDKLKLATTGIILDSYTAAELGATVGDTLTIHNKEIVLSAISFQTSSYMQYCSYKTFEMIFDNDGKYNVVFGRLNDDTEQLECYRELCDWESFDFVTFKSNQILGMKRILTLIYLPIYALLAFAFISVLLITYNVSKINFSERMHDFAISRALGIGKANIKLTTFAEQIIINIIPITCGIFFGDYVATLTLTSFDSEMFRLVNVNNSQTFVIVSLVMLLLISISHLLAASRLNRLKLSEELKARS